MSVSKTPKALRHQCVCAKSKRNVSIWFTVVADATVLLNPPKIYTPKINHFASEIAVLVINNISSNPSQEIPVVYLLYCCIIGGASRA